jgi:23S rRNA (adenine2030-N6)-methyltransferase
MNYKHQYHFGNFADIFKHIILTVSLEEFVKNKRPFLAIDTHAGD